MIDYPEIEEVLEYEAPDGWTITNLYRERQSVGSDPPILWWVRAENEDEDYITGYGPTIDWAIEKMKIDLEAGFIQKSEWHKFHKRTGQITLTELGLGSTASKPKLNFRRPNAPTQTPTSTEG